MKEVTPNQPGKGSGEGRRVKFEEAFSIQQVSCSRRQKVSHESVSWLGIAGLQRGDESFCNRIGSHVGSLLREQRGPLATFNRKVEAVEEKYHFRGIGEQVVTSFIKLQVRRALGGKDVLYAPCISSTPPLAGNYHLVPWGSSIHLCTGDCWLAIASRGMKAKEMVNVKHVLVNMADFGDDLEIGGDVLAAKRSHEDDDTSVDGTSGTSASTESDAEAVLEKRRRRGRHQKPRRPPRNNDNPLPFIQLSLSLQSELRRL